MFNYEVIIGIEVHAELNTKHKIFSPSLNDLKQAPNTNIHPIDLGLPGTLPRFNSEVLEKAILIAKALNMDITKKMHWDRKNYFYQDNPKGYQITQQQTPIGRHGSIILDNGKEIKIAFMHMEEDTAKSFHEGNITKLDFNRCGVPLVEIVSEPCMRSAQEASAYLHKLREILLYLGVCDCKMEEGNLRVDVNVSIRPVGVDSFNPKVEIKNLNSFKNVEIAIEQEIKHQLKAYNTGMPVYQATKRFDDTKKDVFIMRIKESASDYRYFPEPDLPWIILNDEDILSITKNMPLLPDAIKKRLSELKFNEKEIKVLMQDRFLCLFFIKAIDANLDPKQMFNYLTVNINEYLNKNQLHFQDLNINIIQFQTIDKYLKANKISSKHVKTIIPLMVSSQDSVEQIIKDNNLEQITDKDVIRNIIKEVINNNQATLALYKEGKKSAFGFFVGEVMKASNNQVSPQLTNEILKEVLDSYVKA